MDEGHLIRSAAELAKELNKVVDEHLPKKLASITPVQNSYRGSEL